MALERTFSIVKPDGVARNLIGATDGLKAAPGMMKAMSKVMGVIEKVIPVPEDYSAEYLRISAGTTYIGDNAKARRELGYDPRPLREGLTETLHHEMRLLGMPVPSTNEFVA